MSKATFYIRNDYVKKSGESAIYIACYIDRKKVLLPTGVECKPKDFDKVNGKIRGNTKEVKDKNIILEVRIARVTRIKARYNIDDKNLTADLLKKEYENPVYNSSFVQYMDMEIENRKGMLTETTIKQQRAALNKLVRFCTDVTFADFNLRFVEDFKKFLKVSLKNHPNTIEANIKNLKIYMAKAVADGRIDQNVFSSYKSKRVKTSFTYLELSELKKLFNLYREGSLSRHHQIVLRHFLFQCYTGLRFSDVRQITHEMISNNKLYFIPHKTKNSKRETLIVPLIGMARRLIKDENPLRVYGNVFNTYAEQFANRSLKKIMTAAGIDKHVSTHVGRHTFATLYYEKTSDVASLQKLLGHSRITETMIYAHVSEAKKELQMKSFESFLTE